MRTFQISGRIAVAVWLGAALACGCKKTESPAEKANLDSAASAKPVISAAASEFDFGTVKQGAEVEHVFKLKNTGNKDLVIEKTTGS